MQAKQVFVGFSLAVLALFSGCADPAHFEKLTGPLSPPGIAMVASGGLRDKLFPGSESAFKTCMQDPEACASSGGVQIQVSPAGKATLSHMRSMMALQLGTPDTDTEFAAACETFAKTLFAEDDGDAYEVSMRILALLTAEESSPLHCAVRAMDGFFAKELDGRWLDPDVAKLTVYAEAILASRLVWQGRGKLGSGAIGRLATVTMIAGSGALLYVGVKGTVTTLELDRWAKDSGTRFFVGRLNWNRKYVKPSQLMHGFRNRFESYLNEGGTVKDLIP